MCQARMGPDWLTRCFHPVFPVCRIKIDAGWNSFMLSSLWNFPPREQLRLSGGYRLYLSRHELIGHRYT